jgi:hypothetical protein
VVHLPVVEADFGLMSVGRSGGGAFFARIQRVRLQVVIALVLVNVGRIANQAPVHHRVTGAGVRTRDGNGESTVGQALSASAEVG